MLRGRVARLASQALAAERGSQVRCGWPRPLAARPVAAHLTGREPAQGLWAAQRTGMATNSHDIFNIVSLPPAAQQSCPCASHKRR